MNAFKSFGFLLALLPLVTHAQLANQKPVNTDDLEMVEQIQKLDTLRTCQTKTQKRNAITAIRWLRNFETWDLAAQSKVMNKHFLLWHSSLAGLATFYKKTNPELHKRLPFPDSKISCKNYVDTLAFLATSNDITKWVEEPKAIYCLDGRDVAIDIAFSGYQVHRNAAGYIEYEEPYHAPATKLFSFDQSGKVTKQVVGLDSATSALARAKLKARVDADPDQTNTLPPNEDSKGTYSDFKAKFEKEFLLKCP